MKGKMTKKTARPVVHWAGGIIHDGGYMLAGWPCCCSGSRAEAIKRAGNQTIEASRVTCKRCRAWLAKVAA